MPKNAITDYSTTAASNTDLGGVDSQGSAAASNIDDLIRELMSHLAETNAGTSPLADTFCIGDTADLTKKMRFELSAITAGQTRVVTMPDANVTIPSGTLVTETSTSTLTNKTLTSPVLTTPQINDTSADHQYVFAVSELAADRTVTLPLLTGNDTFVFLAHHVQAEATWTTGTGTTESLVTPAKIKAAAIVAGGGAPDAVLEDQKATTTDGGTATAGSWETRTLNTEVRDNGGIISIAANAFTPTVAGWVEWEAPAMRCGFHQSRLYNVTGAAAVAYGSNCSSAGAVDNSCSSFGGGAVAAGTAYRIEHRVSSTKANDGYGQANSFGGTEVYTRVKFWRTA
jgi:hypothetical protein